MFPHIQTSRSGSGKGNGWSKTALTRLKIAVFAPMPRAKAIKATNVKPGRFARLLIPCRMSRNRVSIKLFPIADFGLRIADFSFETSNLIAKFKQPKSISFAHEQNFEIRNPQSEILSLVSKSHQRIDFCRAARGDVAGEQSHHQQAE